MLRSPRDLRVGRPLASMGGEDLIFESEDKCPGCGVLSELSPNVVRSRTWGADTCNAACVPRSRWLTRTLSAVVFLGQPPQLAQLVLLQLLVERRAIDAKDARGRGLVAAHSG
jgi:hypothetical protein